LAEAAPPQETRKVVTIVFSDLKGSTSLGESLDSEALREVLSRYFDDMRTVLERHGGVVEKFIGDAVMAVFGLPTVHEDDALRAVRAAAEMRVALARLNDELHDRWGVRLTNRTGVNTGEVVAGDPTGGQRLVTGDTVNVAARLEQAAPELEVLVGEPTYRLVRDAVEVEEVEPLELKGKAERVPAYRLLAVHDDPRATGRPVRPLVGRAEELALLRGAFEDGVATRAARLVAVLGEAGMGKTRLVDEFIRETEESARVLRGRCLPYGSGITFWPLIEILRAAADVRDEDGPAEARAKLEACAGDADVARRLASLSGLSDELFSLDELFWATRKLCETFAAEQPLVLVVEDVHWAESTLLDLVASLANNTVDVPLLVLCPARPALAEVRPGWLEETGATTLALEPLSPEASAAVAANVLGEALLDAGVRARIVESAEGNPLFVEQLLSMLVDEGLVRQEDDRWVPTGDLSQLALPPTIHALLAARLDLLSPDERAVIEPASVVGLAFQEAAVRELVPDAVRDRVPDLLAALTRKQFVRPERADGQESLYRFQHILVKDAAYAGLLKRTRATLHERFADWGERVNADRDRATEYEEIVGYHLEQAYTYLAQLGPLDAHGHELGRRGWAKLSSAGRRAFARGDMPAAANLLRRASALLPDDDPDRLALLPDLGEALTEIGELPWVEVFLEQAIEAAITRGDARLREEAALVRLLASRHVGDDGAWGEQALAEAKRAIPVFEAVGDDAGLARAWRIVQWVHTSACRFEETAQAASRAMEHARRAGDRRQEGRAGTAYAMAALYGPTPVDEAIARCEEVLERSRGDRRTEGLVMCFSASLRAMQGDFGEARQLVGRARATLEEIGGTLMAASTSLDSYAVEWLAGDLEAAERDLRRDYEALAALKETYLMPTVAGCLARTLCLQGRFDDADEFARVAEAVAAADDVSSQALWRTARAQVLAKAGDVDAGVVLASEAVDLLRATDFLVTLGDALTEFASVLEDAARGSDAAAALAEAVVLYDRKGNAVAAAAVRDRLAAAAPL
ncbi:MAG TPA: adenylate/guanylate cyclase domain-containing protein, partial [Gaiella sp.]|nr:adenylate/guanylate cyclase domain-containing protein [Gaiella sp.]